MTRRFRNTNLRSIRFFVLGLLGILPWAISRGQDKTPSAKQILEQFCKLDAEGASLTEEGRAQVSSLLLRPPASPPRKFLVIKDYAVGPAEVVGTSAKAYVEYIELGVLDSSPRFADLPKPFSPGPIKVRKEYELKLSESYSEAEPNRKTSKTSGALQWKIERTPSEPRITVDTAIRYVTNLRDHAPDSKGKDRAEAALKSLQRQKATN